MMATDGPGKISAASGASPGYSSPNERKLSNAPQVNTQTAPISSVEATTGLNGANITRARSRGQTVVSQGHTPRRL